MARVFTIGHSNRKWSDFISVLKDNHVDLLVYTSLQVYLDGCFPDAGLILSEEEYFNKVLFDWALLQRSGVFNWVINSEQGYVQNGQFKQNFKWALIYERIKDDNAIAFNSGDLLIYVTLDERLKWRQFYKSTDIKIDYGDKLLLLFFDKNNDQETGLISKYWAKRIENLEETGDLPRWTKSEKDRVMKSC